jgi:quinoprotein glucose dehydrogenase
LWRDSLIFCSPYNRVFAIDAATGAERWVYDPKVDVQSLGGGTCRGVAVWDDPDATPGAACASRVFTGTQDARLLAVDAATGVPCADFARVDLTRGLGDVAHREVKVTSLPTLVRDVVTIGHNVSDNRRADAPGGVIRGFDARTGALRWAFDPVPPGTAPLPEAADGPQYHRGTPNSWSVSAADSERDLVFVPMGNPSNDFYRGGRGEIDYYGSAVVALRGSTGEVVWHFQTVHHDLWDYDVGSQPSLIELEVEGHTIPALVQPTKVGNLFVLHRETGEPLFPIEERAVPRSDAPGEQSAATQPFPTKPPPLHPGGLGPDDVWGLTPIDEADCRERLAALRSEGPFTPPSLQGSLQYPGVAGGANWGSAAWDPQRGLLLVTQTRLGTVHRLIPQAETSELTPNPPREILFPQQGSPYAVHQTVFLSSLGIPCSPPPWSELLAVDLARGEIAWRVPFGTTRGQAPWPFWLRWGIPGMGGPIVTAGGLTFIGAAMDGYLRAFDTETGEELWRDVLPAGGQATPMTYRLNPGGRQYLVIAAGGHSTLGTQLGDFVIAYALPEAPVD